MNDISTCSTHKDKPAPVRGCSTCHRINIERDIVLKTVDALLAAGFYLAVNDQGGDRDIRPTTPTHDRAAIVKELMETDDDFLACYRAPEDRLPESWVRFVYGNDGWDVISDYLTSLDPVLVDVLAYADEVGGKLMARPIIFEDEEGVEHELATKLELCDACDGEGTHVNRNIDGNGISQEEFDEDPDFAEAYFAGRYDVRCETCKGERVIAVVDEARIPAELLEQYHGYQDSMANLRAEEASERRMFGY